MTPPLRPSSPFDKVVAALLACVPTRVVDLAIDQLPNRAYRFGIEAHDAWDRASDAVLTYAAARRRGGDA